jgi:5-methylcytosine-specific restriction endonuclease McrA
VRAKVKKRDGYRCVKCGTRKRLEVHHLSYAHQGDELNHLEDLVTLCRSCHRKEHNL